MKKYDVIVMGAGPAGIATAQKLSENGKSVLVIDKDSQVGGISKTVNYKIFLFDLGPHRFFTKSKTINKLWEDTLGEDFLPVDRLTRIYYKNKFFNYPIKPVNALQGLGIITAIQVLLSYLWIKIYPYPREDNFEEWVSNRFGYKLYSIFFKSYTEKLWGIPCAEIQAEWVAQRIKGLSMRSAIKNALFPKKNSLKTLVEEFHYPKYGSGMMYEKMAENAKNFGAEFLMREKVLEIFHENGKAKTVKVKNLDSGEVTILESDYLVSSIPLTFLAKILNPAPDQEVLEAINNLKYRSTLIINLIYKKTKNPFPDNWIYVHSPEVKMLRIGNPANMSPFMVPDKEKIALGVEYVCEEKGSLWNKNDEELIDMAVQELEMLDFLKKSDFSDGFVIRVPKTYPVYSTSYPENFEKLKKFIDGFQNLQPIGRYGMFKYNNMDHSLLTGIYAAENILGANHDIWEVNEEKEYHEEKK
jgi:protoporphyrinogen oxidase